MFEEESEEEEEEEEEEEDEESESEESPSCSPSSMGVFRGVLGGIEQVMERIGCVGGLKGLGWELRQGGEVVVVLGVNSNLHGF